MANAGDFLYLHQGRFNRAKLLFRCACFVISIILIGLSVNQGLNWGSYTYTTSWWITLPIVLFGTIVDCIELIAGFLRKRNPGIHPGWHIGIELGILGGNIAGLIFISSNLSPYYRYYWEGSYPFEFIPLSIPIMVFLGLFTLVRFILFVIACIDTHRYHVAAQVELIVQTLRQQNLSDPTTAAAVHDSLYPKSYINYPRPVVLPEQTYKMKPHHEFGNESAFYPELPDNQKFLAGLSPRALH